MKTLRLAIIATAALSLAACNGSGNTKTDTTAPDTTDTTVSPSLNDSISETYGTMVGMMVNSDIKQFPSDEPLDKAKILKAVQMIMAADNSESTGIGCQIALTMIHEMNEAKKEGIEFNRSLVLNNFKKSFMLDSVTTNQIDETMGTYRQQREGVQKRIAQRDRELRELDPKAIQNTKVGEAYIDNVIKNDPTIKTTPSGLAYKIDNAGTQPAVGPRDLANVKYRGTFTDGTVFDEGTANLSPMGVIPGMAEALQMLGKGGKGTFIIPGKIAYGVDGVPGANIGPNQTLIFEVEVLDVTTPAQK